MNTESEKKKILISGAFGFIGTNISNNLGENYHLVALDIENKYNEKYSNFFSWNEIESINWDNLHAVIHLAGKAHDTNNILKENEFKEINVGLTEQIFKRFLKSHAQKFIYMSSVKAVADTFSEGYLTEEIAANPTTPYGRSKLAAEKTIHFLASREPEAASNRQIYILRPCMVQGPGNKGNLNDLVRYLKAGFPWPLGSFDNKRTFTSIGNLIYIIQQIIDKDIEPGLYHISDDESLATNDLIRIIGKFTNIKVRILNLPTRLIIVLVRFSGMLGLPFNKSRFDKLVESYQVSNKKIKEALGIKNMPISTTDGLRETFRKL